jgi:hypothetical protein
MGEHQNRKISRRAQIQQMMTRKKTKRILRRKGKRMQRRETSSI